MAVRNRLHSVTVFSFSLSFAMDSSSFVLSRKDSVKFESSSVIFDWSLSVE